MQLKSIIGAGILAMAMSGACEFVFEPYPAPPDAPRAEPDEPRQSDPVEPEVDKPGGEQTQTPREAAYDHDKERAIALFTVAGGKDQPEQLHLVDTVWEKGWDAYIDEQVLPEIRRGFRRIIVLKACGMQPVSSDDESGWNVVGRRGKTKTDVRSRALTLSQLQRHRPDLASSFVRSWSRVGSQVDEIMLYIGLPAPDATQGEIEAWVAPFMRIPNVSFGLDSLGGIDADAAGGKLLEYLLSEGKRVYVEPVMPTDEWESWPTDHDNFAATVIDRRYELMAKPDQKRWPNASEVGDELVVLVQGQAGEDAQGRYMRIASYLTAAEPHQAGVAFGTRGLSEGQVRNLIEIGRR